MPPFQTAHAIGEGGLRHAADVFEALGQRRHGGVGSQVVGEVDEADPAPGHHGAEDEQRPDLAPVEDHHVARGPHAGAPSPVVLRPPLGLHLGHQATQVAGRALIAGGPDDGQEALGRDPAFGPLHPFGHHVPDGVVVVGHRLFEPGLGPLGGEHRLLDRSVRGATDLGGPSIRAHLPKGRSHVHAFPHWFHRGVPSVGAVGG